MKRFLLLLAFLSLPGRAGPGEPINLDIGTPPVVVVKHSLAQRASRLVRFYDAGIIGLGYDGMVKMRDGSRLTLPQRQIAEKLIDNENPDRNSLIYALAEAHGGRPTSRRRARRRSSAGRSSSTPAGGSRMRQGKWSMKP
jgi:hypothetical protein